MISYPLLIAFLPKCVLYSCPGITAYVSFALRSRKPSDTSSFRYPKSSITRPIVPLNDGGGVSGDSLWALLSFVSSTV